ncbi:MAG: ATP-binding cassette domain-containing protein [Deltaproteobacteria bacterium]|nr:ATP-binding cassette domain-containing protein [Deltaproteobacteria bacterium]
MAAVIRTEGLAVSFDGLPPVFEGLDLIVEQGEFVTLVGVSGSGKSTLLRVIADLITATKGSITVEQKIDPTRRSIAMVFQAPNLMPWRRVKDNIGLGLEGLQVTDQTKHDRIEWCLNLVGLAGLGERWPYQLSGGQRQRVGIARALAVDPNILLMDEPFAAVDAITRGGLQTELLRIWEETGKSILFVTHDIEEAVQLGNRVLLLGHSPARIVREYLVDSKVGHEGAEFQRMVQEVRHGLQLAMDSSK